MKSLNLVTTLAIAAALVVGVTGCKKTPKPLTSIPRMNMAPISDDPTIGRLPNGATNRNNVGASNRVPGDFDPGSNPLSTKPIDLTNAGTQTSRPDANLPEDRTALQASTVYFEYDRSSVKSSEVSKVQEVATYLKSHANVLLRVEGNCDERGTEEYNRSLGERRALAVRELLIAFGVAPDRVTTLTLGEDKPADAGHDETAWSKNRRAEFVVLLPGSTAPNQ
jgi:peptidoglycan-associated lipoprotein